MEAEGTALDIAALVDELKDARWTYIASMDEKSIPLEGGYGFEIR